jgi:hypothetical protein
VIYRDELGQHRDAVQVTYTLTRGQPAGWTGHAGRIDGALLEQVAWPAEAKSKSMSMSDEPQEESMSMGQPDEESMSTWASQTKTPCDG